MQRDLVQSRPPWLCAVWAVGRHDVDWRQQSSCCRVLTLPGKGREVVLCCWAHHSLTDTLQRQPVICDLAVQAALGDGVLGQVTSGAHCCIGVAMRVLQDRTAPLKTD